MFPGGNLSAQDGDIPAPGTDGRHRDSEAYRVGAIRECFEESGLLLARSKDGSGSLLEVEEQDREQGRKDVHAEKVTFREWVQKRGGVVDTGEFSDIIIIIHVLIYRYRRTDPLHALDNAY